MRKLIRRWMHHPDIQDRRENISQSEHRCQGPQRHLRYLWSGHGAVEEALNNSTWNNNRRDGIANFSSLRYMWWTGPNPTPFGVCVSMSGIPIRNKARHHQGRAVPFGPVEQSTSLIFILTVIKVLKMLTLCQPHVYSYFQFHHDNVSSYGISCE